MHDTYQLWNSTKFENIQTVQILQIVVSLGNCDTHHASVAYTYTV